MMKCCNRGRQVPWGVNMEQVVCVCSCVAPPCQATITHAPLSTPTCMDVVLTSTYKGAAILSGQQVDLQTLLSWNANWFCVEWFAFQKCYLFLSNCLLFRHGYAVNYNVLTECMADFYDIAFHVALKIQPCLTNTLVHWTNTSKDQPGPVISMVWVAIWKF